MEVLVHKMLENSLSSQAASKHIGREILMEQPLGRTVLLYYHHNIQAADHVHPLWFRGTYCAAFSFSMGILHYPLQHVCG